VNQAEYHVGVVLPRGATSGEPLRTIAREAEALGYASLWSTEHIALPLEFTSRYPFTADGRPPFKPTAKWFEGMVVLGFVAGITEHIGLGTAVIPLFNRDPLSLAKQAATVDCLSGGRLELGVGAGWLTEEAAVLGHPSDHRSKRLAEAIDILRKAWSPDPVEHHGAFYDIPAVGVSPKPPQGAEIPIWIGGTGPAAIETTVSRAAGNILWTQDIDEARRLCGELKDRRGDVKVAVGMFYDPDLMKLGDRVHALRGVGVNRVLLSPPGDTTLAVHWLTDFRSKIMSTLGPDATEALRG
jgi:probable F420-dependent oxidoreductase